MHNGTIYLEVTGTAPRHRFLITDGSRYYSGSEWIENRRHGMLYADAAEAARAALRLIREEFKHCKLTIRYELPVHIELHANKLPEQEELLKWLNQAVTTQVCYNVFGYGPTPDSLVVVHTDWNSLREVPNHEQKI